VGSVCPECGAASSERDVRAYREMENKGKVGWTCVLVLWILLGCIASAVLISKSRGNPFAVIGLFFFVAPASVVPILGFVAWSVARKRLINKTGAASVLIVGFVPWVIFALTLFGALLLTVL
jgi:hypothetical protein